ncbi:MAG: site-specific integrase [Colwellia sp.]|nr:site-specific integrase [Colwellia sp.]
MSVFKRNGEGNYYIQFNYRGKTFVKSSRTTNKRKAERMERDWRDDIHRMEEMGERPRIKLRDALAGYVDSNRNGRGHRYADSNVSVLNKLFPTSLYTDEVKDFHLTRFKSLREKDGIAAQTIKHNFQAIRSAIKWAKDNGYFVKDVEFPKIKLPKHRLRYLSVDEEKRLLAALEPTRDISRRPSYECRSDEENQKRHDMYDLVVMLLDSGARYSEIANIKWDSIHLEEKTIALWRSKVSNESIIYMTSRVHKILSLRFENKQSDWVFSDQNGGPRGYAPKGIRAAFVRAGLEGVRIHDLRHTCASRLVQNGMSLYEVSQMLGHVDVQTTQIYAHLENKNVGRKARDIMEALAGL